MRELLWIRFALYHPGVPWKNVLIMGIGNPTEEECKKIIDLGLYNKVISPNDKKQFPETGENDEY